VIGPVDKSAGETGLKPVSPQPAVRTPPVPDGARVDKMAPPVVLPARSTTSQAIAGARVTPLCDRLVEAVRPTPMMKKPLRPLRLRLGLLRLADALSGLEIDSTDPLLKTAHRVLTEEQLRIEIVRHRLQMTLES